MDYEFAEFPFCALKTEGTPVQEWHPFAGGSWRSFSEYGRRLESPCTQLRPGRPLASSQCNGPRSSSIANGPSGQRRLATGVLPLVVASTGRPAGRTFPLVEAPPWQRAAER